MGDFYDSLNPDQQQKVRDFMQRRRAGWAATKTEPAAMCPA